MKNKFIKRTSGEVLNIVKERGWSVSTELISLVPAIEEVLKRGYGYLPLCSDMLATTCMDLFNQLLSTKSAEDFSSFDREYHSYEVTSQTKGLAYFLLRQEEYRVNTYHKFLNDSYLVLFGTNMLAKTVLQVIDLFCDTDTIKNSEDIDISKNIVEIFSYNTNMLTDNLLTKSESIFSLHLWEDTDKTKPLIFCSNAPYIVHTHTSDKILMTLGAKFEQSFGCRIVEKK
jgi:hypothetical protein